MTLRMSQPPLSTERAAKRVGAPRGVPKSAEHKARIAAGVRRWNASLEPWQRRRGFRKFLSDEEAADLRLLRAAGGYTEAEALAAIGRPDLIGPDPSLVQRPNRAAG